jgi:hypothetical protein
MDLNKLSIVARTRSPWEAIDLGVTLTKAWWRPLFLSWFVPALVIFLLCSLTFHQQTWLGYTLVWLLKPVLDRGALFIASRRLFGDQANARDLLTNLSTVYRRDWFWSLTMRRLSLTRSFDMPLTVLEQVSGKARSNRQAVLHSTVSGVATWLTIICLHIELFIVLGIGGLLVAMVPEQVDIDILNMMFFEEEVLAEWIYSVCVFLAMCIIGPFYAVAGFILYISRRIDLEAWDIEIRFRHLAAEYQSRQKLAQASTNSLLAIVCSVAVCASLFLPTSSARANDLLNDENQMVSYEAALAKDDIVNVKLGEDFHQIEQDSGWRLKDFEKKQPEDEEVPEWLINFLDYISDNLGFLEKAGEIIQAPGAYIEYLLWSLAVALIIYIIYRYRLIIRNISPSRRTDKTPEAIPDVMFGLDVRQESIPTDVAAAVHALWIQKDYRDAVSLLYRSTLAGLIHYHELDFSASDTEGECLRKVKEKDEENLNRFCTKLTQVWQSLAYGHQLPAEAVIRELCEKWDEVLKRD